MAGFIESLEDKANQIIKNSSNNNWDSSIPAILKRDIALTTDQIDRLRQLHKMQVDELNKTESQIETELVQMEDRTPKYSPLRFPEREKLQKEIISLKGERRRHNLAHQDKLQNLHRNLLTAISRFEHISEMNHVNQPKQTTDRNTYTRTSWGPKYPSKKDQPVQSAKSKLL